MKSTHSLSTRLSRKITGRSALQLLGIVIILGLLSSLFIFQSVVKGSKLLLQNSLSEIQCMLDGVESSTNSFAATLDRFDSREDMLDFAERVVLQDTNIIACNVGFAPYKFEEKEKFFCPFAALSNDGTLFSKILGDNNYDYFLSDWYLIPKLLGKGYWTDPSFDSEGTDRMITSYASPIYRNGEFIGVMKVDIDLKWLTGKIEALKPYKTAHTALIGRNGSFISHYEEDMILRETVFSAAREYDDESLYEMGKDLLEGKSGVITDRDRMIVYAPMKNGWSAALMCDTTEVLFPTFLLMLLFAIVAGFGLIFVYVYANKEITRQTTPITALAYSSLNIAQGNFNAIIPEVDTEDEIKRLRDSLRYLEISAQSYISELRSTTASKERFESELGIASSIQMQMLSTDFIKSDFVDLYAELFPAKEVGGDLYDFFENDEYLYFAVGDVSGKGVPAALYMAITRSAFRFIAGLGLDMDSVVENINNNLCNVNKADMFVTMFVARVNKKTLEMEFCNAGHNPIVVISPDGKPEYLKAKANLAVGLIEGFKYTKESLSLSKGTRLVVYTDGVTEAENSAKDQFGEFKLASFSQRHGKECSSKDYCDDLVKSIKAFTKDEPQNDDITIMSILF